MTIFDALRHPVQDKMSIEEFRAIPIRIREEWVAHPKFQQIYPLRDHDRKDRKIMELNNQNINLLRRIILEWET